MAALHVREGRDSNDGDAAIRRIAHQFAHRLLRIEAAVEARLAGFRINVRLRRGTRRDPPGPPRASSPDSV